MLHRLLQIICIPLGVIYFFSSLMIALRTGFGLGLVGNVHFGFLLFATPYIVTNFAFIFTVAALRWIVTGDFFLSKFMSGRDLFELPPSDLRLACGVMALNLASLWALTIVIFSGL